MRILLVSNGFPPNQWAGTETYTAGISQELAGRDHQVQVLCGGDWDVGPAYWNGHLDEVFGGVSVRRLNVNWAKATDPFRYLYDNPVIADHVASFLQGFQPDLVHVTSCERLSASVLTVAKDFRVPVVVSLTDFWFLCPRINLLRGDGENCDGVTTAWDCLRCMLFHEKAYRWPRLILPEDQTASLLTTISQYPMLTRQRGLRGMAGDMAARKVFLHRALELADVRITASPFVRNVFVENGVTVPIKVQPYGHNLAWLKDYEGKTQSTVVRVGFIGQIIPSKGVHLLVQAVQQLYQEFGDRFELLIYGNINKEPEYGALLETITANMDNLQFCGTYRHEDSAGVFANLDILVVPSLWFDFPLVIYEAFATKTPVIATNLGGMAEAMKHEAGGLLFERGNADDLARQLRRIFVEKDLIDRLRDQIPRVKTIEEEVTELEMLYEDLVTRCVEDDLVTGKVIYA